MQILYHTDSEGNVTGTTMDQEYKDHIDGMQRSKEMVVTVLAIALFSLLALGITGLLVLQWLIEVLT